jgi:hypothetical protein
MVVSKYGGIANPFLIDSSNRYARNHTFRPFRNPWGLPFVGLPHAQPHYTIMYRKYTERIGRR